MLLITAGLLGFNLYGVIHLEQDFDPNWFIPSDSYAADYIKASEKYFPRNGAPVALYVGEEEKCLILGFIRIPIYSIVIYQHL